MQSQPASSSSHRRPYNDPINPLSVKRPRLSEPESKTKPPLHPTSPMSSTVRKGKMPDLGRPTAFQPSSGAKKLVIKNLRAPSETRDEQVEEYYCRIQAELDDALTAVLAGQRPRVPLERLFRGVEDTCRRGGAEKIYRILKEKVNNHVQNCIIPGVRNEGQRSSYKVAKSLLAHWRDFSSHMTLIRSIFSYLDRSYLLRQKLPSINDLTISYFRKQVFPPQARPKDENISVHLICGICGLVDADRREGSLQSSDSALLKGLMRMLYVLGVYVKYFEPAFIAASQPFLEDFGQAHRASSLKTYIHEAEKLLQREHYRVLEYNLDSTTEKQLMDMAHKYLIEDFATKLLDEKSLGQLLSSNDIESVRGLYELLQLSKIHMRLKGPWEEYIKATVRTIVQDKERESEMILRLLVLRRSLDAFVCDSFGKDDAFYRSMRSAYNVSMNDPNVSAAWSNGISKIGELISKHTDMLLRGGIKTLPKELISNAKERVEAERQGFANSADEDAELDRQLDQALELIRLTSGKDAVQAFYQKDLARRLLMGRSASQDAERTMLSKLKAEFGSNYTQNMEQMFKDQQLAKDEMEAYEAWCEANKEKKWSLDMNVMVLSASAWPSYQFVQLNLPNDVASQFERFDKFYKSKHTGRILTWLHCLAHCSVKARFPKGDKELLVSAFQAVVLVLFNSVPPETGFLSYDQISKATGLKDQDLDRTLQSLACGKSRVLSKHPKGRDVRPTDTFTFNAQFSDPKYRIKINQIQQKQTKEENAATHEKITVDRRFETQATIMRVLKARKKLGHAELQSEILALMSKRGAVDPSEIKKELEKLIEKDYIERDGSSYVYVS